MKTIFVRWQREGIHKYPDAPDEVAFLRNDHRHTFHFEVEIEVFHDDREIEFIMFKRDLEKFCDLKSLNNKSCEMICDEIRSYLRKWYSSNRYVRVQVSEDNENGATVYDNPHS